MSIRKLKYYIWFFNINLSKKVKNNHTNQFNFFIRFFAEVNLDLQKLDAKIALYSKQIIKNYSQMKYYILLHY